MPCQPGTFNPLEGQDALADCRPCYPGKACTQVALKFPDVDCMPGLVPVTHENFFKNQPKLVSQTSQASVGWMFWAGTWFKGLVRLMKTG